MTHEMGLWSYLDSSKTVERNNPEPQGRQLHKEGKSTLDYMREWTSPGTYAARVFNQDLEKTGKEIIGEAEKKLNKIVDTVNTTATRLLSTVSDTGKQVGMDAKDTAETIRETGLALGTDMQMTIVMLLIGGYLVLKR